MKLRVFAFLFAAGVFALFLSDPFSAAENKPQWQTGHLISADLSGHGPKTYGKRTDIWWVYWISTGGKTYSLVSRLSPGKAGLTLNSQVKCLVERDRMQILNSKGARIVLRIARKGDESICR